MLLSITLNLQAYETAPLGPIATAFISIVLEQYGFQKKDIDFKKIEQTNKFSVTNYFTTLQVPFNDTDVIALIVHLPEKEKMKLISAFNAHHIKFDWDNPTYATYEIDTKNLEACLEKRINPFDKPWNALQTLYCWHGSLLHEMGHIKCDTRINKKIFYVGILTFASLAAYFSYKESFSLLASAKIIALVYTIRGMLHLLRKYSEIRADFYSIEKAKQNPPVLHAESQFFCLLHNINKRLREIRAQKGSFWKKIKSKLFLKIPFLDELTDEHPRHIIRAAYFERAYEKYK